MKRGVGILGLCLCLCCLIPSPFPFSLPFQDSRRMLGAWLGFERGFHTIKNDIFPLANQPPTLFSASFSSILSRDANLWARAKVRALLPWATALCSSLEENSVGNNQKRKECLKHPKECLKHPQKVVKIPQSNRESVF